MTYCICCVDGNCQNEINTDVQVRNALLVGLDEGQVEEARDKNQVTLTDENISENGLVLTSEEKKTLIEDGELTLEVDHMETVCSECGSDQVYNDEGENISSH